MGKFCFAVSITNSKNICTFIYRLCSYVTRVLKRRGVVVDPDSANLDPIQKTQIQMALEDDGGEEKEKRLYLMYMDM